MPEEQQPVAPPDAADHDEYTGIGGRYVRDPVTGKRQPAPAETETAASAAEGE